MIGSLFSIDEGEFSVLILHFAILISSIFIIPRIAKSQKKDSYLLFSMSYALYSAYAIITNAIYVENPINDFFIYSDQITYYSLIGTVDFSSGIDHILNSYAVLNLDSGGIISFGAYLYFGLTGFIADYILFGNSIVFQKLLIVALSSYTIVYVHRLLLFNFTKVFSYKYTLVYMVFSFTMFHSAFLLRDIHIVLIYLIGFVIVQEDYKLTGLFKLILLLLIAFMFRPSNGLFFSVYIFIYIYKSRGYQKYVYLILALVIGVAGFIYTNQVFEFQGKLNNYYEYAISRSGGSIRGMLYKLPLGLEQIALFIFSQIQPFPNFSYLTSGDFPANEMNIFRLPESIAAFYWFYTWSLVVGLFISKKTILKKIPNKQKLMFWAAVLLILLNTLEIATRRLMIVYPSIYLISLYFLIQASPKTKKIYMSYFLIVYLTLNALYLIVKFL